LEAIRLINEKNISGAYETPALTKIANLKDITKKKDKCVSSFSNPISSPISVPR
jgi:hypothetical protein